MKEWNLRHHYTFEIEQELKQSADNYEDGYFYRYRCGEAQFWFVQRECGHIYAFYIQIDDEHFKSPIQIDLRDYNIKETWSTRADYFYPWCPHISFASLNNLSIKDALQFNEDLEYASAMIQAIAKFMLTSEHYKYYLEKGGKEIVFSV